jgi:hypothetical protein
LVVSIVSLHLRRQILLTVRTINIHNGEHSKTIQPWPQQANAQTLEDSSTLRKHLVAAGGEFIGTFLFLFGNYSLLRRYYLLMANSGLNLTDADLHFTVCLSLVTLPMIEDSELIYRQSVQARLGCG